MKEVEGADLFAGAGGASGGLARACRRLGRRLKLVAVNHSPIAVETHQANYPDAVHLCEELENVNPRRAVPSGRLDILLAGPECTYHSVARGGKPVNDQKRASAWCVLRWASELQIETILIENVQEFTKWGPLGVNQKPLKSRQSETFQAFLAAIRSLNYSIDYRILNAADYGDPTVRKRLFIQCRRGRKPITWPEPTHIAPDEWTSDQCRQPWRVAREIIDWSIPSQSVFSRKRPLAPNTLSRIAAGLRKFGGAAAEPFLVMLNGGGCKDGGGARSLDLPTPTITASGEHLGLVQPFILPPEGIYRGNAPRSLDQPLQTTTSRGGGHLVQPFIISMEHSGKDSQQSCVPYLVPTNHGGTKDGNRRAYPLDKPMPTITTVDAWALVEPFLAQYHGNGQTYPLSTPLPTLDCNDRFALVHPLAGKERLDILFRMLQPHELAAAMSFPRDYVFRGNREQRVRQIGNAWAGELAEKLCYTLLAA